VITMTDKLPPHLLSLFAPRPPLRYLPAADTAPERRKTFAVGGLVSYLSEFGKHDQDYVPTETAEQAKQRRRTAKQARLQTYLEEGLKNCMPPRSFLHAFITLDLAPGVSVFGFREDCLLMSR